MKRSHPLKVERLEDRWVPAADAKTALIDAAIVTVAPTDTSTPADVSTAADGSSYVIDPYLIDPNAPPPPAKTADPIPDSGWTNPDTSPIPPIGDPFWS